MPFFITADGSSIEVAAFARRLGPLPPDVDLVDYVVEKMGFIWFDRAGSGCRVRLEPTKVTPATEAALYFALHDGPTHRVIVSCGRSPALQHRLYPTGKAAVSAINTTIEADRQQRTRRFSQRSTGLGTLGSYPSLQRLLEHYRISNGVSDQAALQDLLPTITEGRYLLVERQGDDDALVIRDVGNGYRAFSQSWSTQSHGLRLEEQPDAEYGYWLANNYLAAMRDQSPRSDEVDATIYQPGLGRRRYTYRRLMLPFVVREDRQFLLSASLPDPSVDLRGHQAVETC